MENNNDFLFKDEDEVKKPLKKKKEKEDYWKVLIVDDEKDIHQVTRLVFKDFDFEKKGIKFYSAYSAEEAKKLIQEHPDTALILLDVVMEKEDSGLEVTKFLRNELKNNLVRIILRTGQPGKAPESRVIIDYDINDYKEKTELTKDKFFTAVTMALRSFRDLMKLEESASSMNRFLPHTFLKLLNKESILQVKLGDYIEQEMTVLFLDMQSFTKMTENPSPLESFKFVNTLMGLLEPAIIQHEGFIDKYVGDAIMALFCGTPNKAINASIEMLKSVQQFNLSQIKSHHQPITISIGINFGLLALGTIGFHDHMDCTAISDAVNVASGLEKLNRKFNTSLLLTKDALAKIDDPQQFNYRCLGNVILKGHEKSTSIYELFDADDEQTKKLKIQTKNEFEHAVQFYNANQGEKAYAEFEKILALNPEDAVARAFIDSIKNKTK